MKKKFTQKFLLFAMCFCLQVAFAQTDATVDSDVESDIDSLFENAEDVGAVKAPPPKTPENNKESKKGISLAGVIDAKVGGYFYFYPRAQSPGATFQNKLGFVANTNDNWFHVEGSLLTEFPAMKIDIYELFFNYMPYGACTISAGKRKLEWGFDSMLDTNVLDDERDTIVDPEKILDKDIYNIENSLFNVQLIVPFPPYITITGLVFYKKYLNSKNIEPNDLAYAGKFEGKLGNYAMNIYAKSWAFNDSKAYDPVVGLEFEGTPFEGDHVRSHFNTQYSMHFNSVDGNATWTRIKGHASFFIYIKDPVRLGARMEYQIAYDRFIKDKEKNTNDTLNQYIAGELGWKHWIGNTGRDLGLAVKVFHDFRQEYGVLTPGIQVENIIKYADFKVAFPIYYGNKNFAPKYGVVAELILHVSY